MPGINESPDEIAMLIAVFKDAEFFFFFFFFFFFRIRILECMILMIRLPNLFYQGIYVSLACALLVSVSALLF